MIKKKVTRSFHVYAIKNGCFLFINTQADAVTEKVWKNLKVIFN